MDLPQIANALFDRDFQANCLKSSDLNLRLRYLETVLSYNTALTQPKLLDNLARDLCEAIQSSR